MKKLLILLAIVSLLFSVPAFAVQKDVILLWDHDGVDLAGFKIYWGDATTNYSQEVDVGMATTCPEEPEAYCHTLQLDIPEGAITNIYFAATAYDDGNNESGFSEEAVGTWDFELPPSVTDLAASYNEQTQMLTFTWSYETAWLPKIEKWSLYDSDADTGPWNKVVDIPYDPNASPPYTTDVELPVPENKKVTKYFTIVAIRPSENNSAFSGNSNVVSVTVDRMPPKSPFEFKIKIK